MGINGNHCVELINEAPRILFIFLTLFKAAWSARYCCPLLGTGSAKTFFHFQLKHFQFQLMWFGSQTPNCGKDSAFPWQVFHLPWHWMNPHLQMALPWLLGNSLNPWPLPLLTFLQKHLPSIFQTVLRFFQQYPYWFCHILLF